MVSTVVLTYEEKESTMSLVESVSKVLGIFYEMITVDGDFGGLNEDSCL